VQAAVDRHMLQVEEPVLGHSLAKLTGVPGPQPTSGPRRVTGTTRPQRVRPRGGS
jgi:hypothetical protein